VLEERQAPTQIILGSNDPDFCVHLNLGLYLEHMYPERRGSNGEINCFGFSGSTDSSKSRVGRVLRECFEGEDFALRFGGNTDFALRFGGNTDVATLGSHSFRKFVATHARRNGCLRDEIDLRGRWKHKKRMVGTYIDTTIPFPDAKVSADLSVGGPILYEYRKDSYIDDAWVLEVVVPTIFKHHPCKSTSVLFRRAVLWAYFEPSIRSHVPKAIIDRVTAQYERRKMLETPVNPIKKVGLVIAGHEGQLFIDRLPDVDAEEDAASPGGASSCFITDMNQRRRQQSS
jgi:hypothetical protein